MRGTMSQSPHNYDCVGRLVLILTSCHSGQRQAPPVRHLACLHGRVHPAGRAAGDVVAGVAAMSIAPPPRGNVPRHGTRSRYRKGCREECCRRVEREYRARYRAAKKARS